MLGSNMNWYPCDVCGKSHPFRVPRDRGCPNEALLRVVAGGKERTETGLSSRISVEAKGEVSDPAPDKGREEVASVPTPAAGVSETVLLESPAEVKGKFDRERYHKEYMREYMRRRRAKGKVP